MSCKYIFLGAIVLLAGCTCRQEIKAYIKDAETGLPVKDVKVVTIAAMKGNYREGSTRYTDSTGRFVSAYDIGGVAKCPVTKLFISRDSFKDKIVISPQMGDTIFIERVIN
ncbi:MAG: hypothetical protein JNL72_10800 [Flavipsychrobacter sp.]|nr:hypothetical protein [Flavipsychrobacter sp.]